MLIGPASDATLLEIAVLGLAGDDPFVIHATPLRPRFPAASGQAVTRHTDETIERAAEWFAELSDLLDPETIVAERLDDLQSIVVAVDAVRIDEARLRDAVMAARRNGRSLHQIAASLGVSRQAARQRFGNFRPALTPARSREPMTTPVSQSHR